SVDELQLCGVDRTLIRLNCRFKLLNEGYLGVELLFWYGVLTVENAIPLQIHFRIRKQRLVSLLLSFGLLELHLKRSRIDLCDEISGLHVLTFLDSKSQKLTIDSSANRYGVKRGYRSQTVQVDRKISAPGTYGCNRNGLRRCGAHRFFDPSTPCGKPQQK